MFHELKIDEPYFEQVISGDKTFEIRYNDRGYQKGGKIKLVETRATGVKTGRDVYKKISYVTNFQQKEHWVVFGIIDTL